MQIHFSVRNTYEYMVGTHIYIYVCVCLVCVSQVISFIAVFLLTLPHGRHLQLVKVIQVVVHISETLLQLGYFMGSNPPTACGAWLKENPGIAWTTPFD